jgi:hypothetical protein
VPTQMSAFPTVADVATGALLVSHESAESAQLALS